MVELQASPTVNLGYVGRRCAMATGLKSLNFQHIRRQLLSYFCSLCDLIEERTILVETIFKIDNYDEEIIDSLWPSCVVLFYSFVGVEGAVESRVVYHQHLNALPDNATCP